MVKVKNFFRRNRSFFLTWLVLFGTAAAYYYTGKKVAEIKAEIVLDQQCRLTIALVEIKMQGKAEERAIMGEDEVLELTKQEYNKLVENCVKSI